MTEAIVGGIIGFFLGWFVLYPACRAIRRAVR